MGRATLPKLLEGVMGWFSYKVEYSSCVLACLFVDIVVVHHVWVTYRSIIYHEGVYRGNCAQQGNNEELIDYEIEQIHIVLIEEICFTLTQGVSADDNSERAVPNKAMNHKRSTYEEGTAPPSFDSPVIITPEEEPQKSHEFWLLVPLTLSCASLRKIPKVWVGEQGLEELPFKPRGLPRVLQQSTVSYG